MVAQPGIRATVAHYKQTLTKVFELSDAAWDEATDPLRFVLSSAVLVVSRKSRAGTPVPWVATSVRAALAIVVMCYMALGAVFGFIVPRFGDSLWFAVSAFVATLLVALPDALKDAGRANPRRLRIVMWSLEPYAILAAIIMLVVWGSEGPSHDTVIGAIIWGFAVVSAADLSVLWGSQHVAFYDTYVKPAGQAP